MKKTPAQLHANRVTSAGYFWWMSRHRMVLSAKPSALDQFQDVFNFSLLVFVVRNRVAIH
jgi:hypothetical protein